MASDVHSSKGGAKTDKESQLIIRRSLTPSARKQLSTVVKETATTTATTTKKKEEEEAAEATGPGRPSSSRPASRPSSSVPDRGSTPGSSGPADRPAIVSSPSGNGTSTAYDQFYLEYALMAEYNQLHRQKVPGVYVIPSAKSPLHWFGVLFIRQGLYQEGIFKFDLLIPENYPDGDCPRLVFRPAIFHPIVDPVSGELDVQRAFAKWMRNVNHIWQVLLYARRVFFKIDTKLPLNPEAAVLYEEDMDLFKSRVGETVAMCKSRQYDPPYSDDPHALRFCPWDADKHQTAQRAILTPKPPKQADESGSHKNAQTSGLSWVKPGTLQVFSKD